MHSTTAKSRKIVQLKTNELFNKSWRRKIIMQKANDVLTTCCLRKRYFWRVTMTVDQEPRMKQFEERITRLMKRSKRGDEAKLKAVKESFEE